MFGATGADPALSLLTSEPEKPTFNSITKRTFEKTQGSTPERIGKAGDAASELSPIQPSRLEPTDRSVISTSVEQPVYKVQAA